MKRDSHEVKNVMYWLGWSNTDTEMSKHDINGDVVARFNDDVWKSDLNKATDPDFFRG